MASFLSRTRSITCATNPQREISIRRFNLSSHKDSRISSITKPTYLGLSLSPDGRYLIYSQIDEQGADLMMVENFR